MTVRSEDAAVPGAEIHAAPCFVGPLPAPVGAALMPLVVVAVAVAVFFFFPSGDIACAAEGSLSGGGFASASWLPPGGVKRRPDSSNSFR